MRRLAARLRSNLSDDTGAALVMVIIMGIVLMTFVATATLATVSSLRKTATDEDWNAAMAAAYAGVEDYQSRVGNDNTYVRYGNPAAPFTVESGSSSMVVMPLAANDAFATGKNGKWGSVSPGSAASFRYEVDNSKYSATGTIRLRATGRVGDAVRSLVVNLRQKGFVDFLYFTDFEIQDPEHSGAPATCVKYAFNGRTKPTTTENKCGDVAFGDSDRIYGPVHSNDAIRACDSQFYGRVTTGYLAGNRFVQQDAYGRTSGCGKPLFDVDGLPMASKNLPMPKTNAVMRNEVRYDLVDDPGCLYTGPTSVTLHGDGTMTVRSPLTYQTQINGATPPAGRDAIALCGDPAKIRSATGQKIPVIDGNLMYVQDVPSDSGDPNYASTTKVPTNCSVGGVVSNGIGYPRAGEVVPGSTAVKSYNCRKGDVFINGKLNGQMTVAAQNYVYVTGNITYADGTEESDDMLGLVGSNAVWVWNPMKCTTATSTGVCTAWAKILTDTGRNIDATMLSVEHTFQVQNYGYGGHRGNLTIKGGIAQKFRGIVYQSTGSRSGGYDKDYHYDNRLRYMGPPKYLSPVSASYAVSQLIEISAAFDADGTPRLAP